MQIFKGACVLHADCFDNRQFRLQSQPFAVGRILVTVQLDDVYRPACCQAYNQIYLGIDENADCLNLRVKHCLQLCCLLLRHLAFGLGKNEAYIIGQQLVDTLYILRTLQAADFNLYLTHHASPSALPPHPRCASTLRPPAPPARLPASAPAYRLRT